MSPRRAEEIEWPSVADPPDTTGTCPYCGSIDGEDHSESCPRFLPLCVCGFPARRFYAGEWWCRRCFDQGRA